MTRRSQRAARKARTSFEDALGARASSLRWLLPAGSIALVLALICLAVLLAFRQYDAAKRHAANNLRTHTAVAAAALDTYFRGELAKLQSLAGSPSATARNLGGMNAYS